MIQPKTFAQWLANYIDKPGPRGEFARDWHLVGPDNEADAAHCIELGEWSDGTAYNPHQEYYTARRAYAVYCLRHVRRYQQGASQ